METLIQEKALACKEHLCRLAALCGELDAALRGHGMTPEQSRATFRAAISGECIGCGIQVSGEELYALSQPPSGELASAKTGRLRLGDCARQGCNAWYYRLTFSPHPGVNWREFVLDSQSRDVSENGTPTPARRSKPLLPWTTILQWRLWPRIGMGLATILVLLFARHWYRGGRIPLVREPETFQVDTAPEEEVTRTADTGPAQ